MNRQQAKDLLPIIQAFAEGKTILVQEDIDWCYLGNESDFNLNPQRYRIKPEPKYRPFTNADECWQEMLKHQPFGWVKDKKTNEYELLKRVSPKDGIIDQYTCVFERCVFADETPLWHKRRISMRIIKFKGKCAKDESWVFGDLCHVMNYVAIKPFSESYRRSLVDPTTVCQFTGLTDKNGKEIYEGDVLRSDIYPFSNIEYNERDNYFAVIYHCKENASFLLQKIKNPKTSITGISDDFSDYITQEEMAEFEVIGSIHDFKWKQYRKYFQTKEETDAASSANGSISKDIPTG